MKYGTQRLKFRRFAPAVELIVLALVAIPVASAAGATEHWYKCQGVAEGTGQFSESSCLTAGGAKKFSLNQLTEGLTQEIEPRIVSKYFTFDSTNAGVKFKVDCSGLSGPGKARNPAGGGSAELMSVVLNFTGCKVTEPVGKGCVIESGFTSGSIETNALKAYATGNRGLKIEPEAGASGSFTTLKVSGCNSTALNGEKVITGSMTGLVSASNPNRLEFTSTSSALTFGGQVLTFLRETQLVAKGTTTLLRLAP